jgi:hypothetical protein
MVVFSQWIMIITGLSTNGYPVGYTMSGVQYALLFWVMMIILLAELWLLSMDFG